MHVIKKKKSHASWTQFFEVKNAVCKNEVDYSTHHPQCSCADIVRDE